ncbi:beta-1,3-galactosyltransferase 5-like [Babylonia areolata]|uniref:beta-1,3-galactosyltransferase 5-like n=1 Tax=Babylonia areolata TaxID=304850 RepID=UPI003FD4A442
MTTWRMSSMERSFLLVVVVVGAVLFLIASNMIQITDTGLFSRYVLARRDAVGQTPGALSEDTIDHIARVLTVETTVPPVTDPPWMSQTPRPLRSFVPSQPHPFLKGDIIASPDVCRNVSVDLLIVIHSAVGDFQRRRILRETWAAVDTIHNLTVRRVFFLGRDMSSSLTQVLVNTEQANFGDIVQGDFVDSFSNLTRKAVTALRWINNHCLHARFILKTDDDIFVNVFRLVENHLKRLSGQRHTVMCNAKADNSSVIIRTPGSKWYVPKSVLAGRTHWPAFCSGFLVVLTTDVIPQLYRASFTAPFVPVDDGYVYGVLPLVDRNVSLRYVDISGDLVVDDGKMLSYYEKGQRSYLAGTALSESGFFRLWQVTVTGLSSWGRLRAGISHLHVNLSAIPL